MRKAKSGHIVITGTGRSGTTLLVQFFSALGFDTGYTLEQVKSQVDSRSKSGLESEESNCGAGSPRGFRSAGWEACSTRLET